IPPYRGVALSFTSDAGAVSYVDKRAVAIVMEEIIPLTVRVLIGIKDVCLEKHIQKAVTVVVAEHRNHRSIGYVDPVLPRHFLEGPIALIDIKEIWRAEPADVDIEQAVVVDVRKCRTLFPDLRRSAFVANARLVGH